VARRLAPADLPELELELIAEPVRPRARLDRSHVLSVSELEVGYGRRIAVREVDLHVRAGEVVALVGHNGCGKSTTLKAIAGLLRPTRGDVVIQTTAPAPSAAGWEAGVRFVPTSRPVFGELSVLDNLRLGLGHKGPPVTDAAARFDHVLTLFPELSGRLAARADTLSGGEQRMLAIGIALMGQPNLLLVDEPTQFLAPTAVQRVLGALRDLADKHAIAILLAEVGLAAALRCADRAYVMSNGYIRSEHQCSDLLASGPTSWWRLF
jgi:branched-chain amino acid transport system ATP-binding protein